MLKRYVVWDMDGTLIDSMEMWTNLVGEYLESQDISPVDHAQLVKQLDMLTVSEGTALLSQHFPRLGSPRAIEQQIDALLERHYREDLVLKPGVEQALRCLSRKDVHMCVASATAEPLIQACLARLGVLHHFDFLLSCETLQTSKREPRIYLEAAKRWAAKPSDIAVCEDAYHALETAHKAGFYTVAVFDQSNANQWADCLKIADESIINKEE